MSRLGILGLLFVAVYAQPTLADHWIAVGSFKDRDTAEKGLLQARAKTPEMLSVVASESAFGINYRVSAGPYATVAEARQVLPSLRQAGLSGAWIWQLERFANDPTASPQVPSQSRLSAALADMERMDFVGLDDVAVLRELRNADSEDTKSGQIGMDDVPQQAPPGYKLHRLRRDN